MSCLPVLLIFLTITSLAAAAAAAEGNAIDQVVALPVTQKEDIAHPIYEFVYEVGEGNGGSSRDFGHKESRDGGRTWGSYFQNLPDGRRQTVKYWADDSGYHAEVEYSGTPRPWTRGRGEGVEGGGTASRATEARQERNPLIAALLDSFPTEKPSIPIADTTQGPVIRLSGDEGAQLRGFSEIRVTVSENGGPHRILQAIPLRQYAKRPS